MVNGELFNSSLTNPSYYYSINNDKVITTRIVYNKGL